MSHLEKILDETFGKKKPKQVEVSLERLHPPMAPPNTVFNEDKQEYSYEVSVDLRKGIYPNESIASEKSDSGRIQGESRTALPSNLKVATSDSKLAIDYHRIADLATFERFLIEAIKIIIPGFQGVPTRVSKKEMTKVFNQRVADYGSVVKEFEDKLAKLQEKRVE